MKKRVKHGGERKGVHGVVEGQKVRQRCARGSSTVEEGHGAAGSGSRPSIINPNSCIRTKHRTCVWKIHGEGSTRTENSTRNGIAISPSLQLDQFAPSINAIFAGVASLRLASQKTLAI